MKNRLIIVNLLVLMTSGILFGCKKLVEIDGPATSVSSKDIYNNDETAAGSLTYLYANLSRSGLIGPGELSSLSSVAGLSADELSYYPGAENETLAAYYRNALTNLNSGRSSDYWTVNYKNLYAVNAALEGVAASSSLTPAVKQQLLGEALFLRAFYYFYLVNLYGDLPLVLNTDYTVNALITKSSELKVYEQIISDLKTAQNLLSENYLKGDALNAYALGTQERVRPTKWTATALLARTYLYLKDWPNAEIQASVVIANSGLYQLLPKSQIDQVFLKNNKEAIWQLQPISNGFNSADAYFFILPDGGPSYSNPVYLNNELIDVFQNEDLRKINWINSMNLDNTKYYYPFKYKVTFSNTTGASVTEYSTIFRLAELYLIRAEARAQLGNLSAAVSDVDEIRKRAGLPLIGDINPGIVKDNLIAAILKEKRLEFFAEWGHRWLDLKRTGKINEVMSVETPKKSSGNSWKNYQQYYPICIDELKANPNLTPSTGY